MESIGNASFSSSIAQRKILELGYVSTSSARLETSAARLRTKSKMFPSDGIHAGSTCMTTNVSSRRSVTILALLTAVNG